MSNSIHGCHYTLEAFGDAEHRITIVEDVPKRAVVGDTEDERGVEVGAEGAVAHALRTFSPVVDGRTRTMISRKPAASQAASAPTVLHESF